MKHWIGPLLALWGLLTLAQSLAAGPVSVRDAEVRALCCEPATCEGETCGCGCQIAPDPQAPLWPEVALTSSGFAWSPAILPAAALEVAEELGAVPPLRLVWPVALAPPAPHLVSHGSRAPPGAA